MEYKPANVFLFFFTISSISRLTGSYLFKFTFDAGIRVCVCVCGKCWAAEATRTHSEWEAPGMSCESTI